MSNHSELVVPNRVIPDESCFPEDQAWKAKAIRDFIHSGLPAHEIGKRYGRSRSTIMYLVAQYKLSRETPVKQLSIFETVDNKPVSPAHRALGVRLTIYRNGRRFTDVGNELGVSRHLLKAMEMGVHDFTLSELQRIATLLNQPIQTIVTPISVAVQ